MVDEGFDELLESFLGNGATELDGIAAVLLLGEKRVAVVDRRLVKTRHDYYERTAHF